MNVLQHVISVLDAVLLLCMLNVFGEDLEDLNGLAAADGASLVFVESNLFVAIKECIRYGMMLEPLLCVEVLVIFVEVSLEREPRIHGPAVPVAFALYLTTSVCYRCVSDELVPFLEHFGWVAKVWAPVTAPRNSPSIS